MSRIFQYSQRHAEQGALRAANPFFATLSTSFAQPKAETPVQSFRSHLKKLELIAKSGDVAGWNQQLPRLFTKAQAGNICLEEDMETKVALCKWEMTLHLEAGFRAKAQGEEMKNQAAAIRDQDPQGAGEILKKASHYVALAEKLHQQLLGKTALTNL